MYIRKSRDNYAAAAAKDPSGGEVRGRTCCVFVECAAKQRRRKIRVFRQIIRVARNHRPTDRLREDFRTSASRWNTHVRLTSLLVSLSLSLRGGRPFRKTLTRLYTCSSGRHSNRPWDIHRNGMSSVFSRRLPHLHVIETAKPLWHLSLDVVGTLTNAAYVITIIVNRTMVQTGIIIRVRCEVFVCVCSRLKNYKNNRFCRCF